MAIDNIFLGLGRKSVGDVTLYRRAGKQCARVRVRNIRNPRSYKQLFTRAILSNVAQLYATGIELFNHSFEGRSVGMENQKRFMKLNVDRLRAMMTDDYNSGAEPSACKARIGARNLKTAVPFVGLQVSEGNYSNTLLTYSSVSYGYSMPSPAAGDTVASYAQRNGILPNDIYTILVFVLNPSGVTMANYGPSDTIDPYSCIFPTYMVYGQLKVHADILSDTAPISAGDALSAVFDYYGGVDISSQRLTALIDANAITEASAFGGIACIRSKWGTDLRSTSYLEQSKSAGMTYGLTYHLLEQAWGDQSGINRADLILDGSNFEPGEGPTNPANYIGVQVPVLGGDVTAAYITAMSAGESISAIYNDWLIVFVRGAGTAVTVNYADPLSAGVPSLKYAYTQGETLNTLTGFTNEAASAGWFTDLRENLAQSDLVATVGAAVSTFGKPAIWIEI